MNSSRLSTGREGGSTNTKNTHCVHTHLGSSMAPVWSM